MPTVAERQEMFELYLKRIKLDQKPEYYSKRLAQMTPGFSGADIANVVNEAAIRAASTEKPLVTVDELDFSLQRILAGAEKRSRTLIEEEREIVAYHESGHALVGWLLEHTDALLKVRLGNLLMKGTQGGIKYFRRVAKVPPLEPSNRGQSII
ncbi:unnamed protein product [Toxocara canis]|uniref:Paraplegin n=1 Tax=Toxocara canis TaxID=6265 RepID=A0A3P7INX2_TOXCA|nr:unnamed protein product [Toxocara canis]